MSSCNGPPIVSTLSGMVAMAGEAEKEVEEEGKPPKKVINSCDDTPSQCSGHVKSSAQK